MKAQFNALTIILATLVIFSLVGCGQDPVQKTNSEALNRALTIIEKTQERDSQLIRHLYGMPTAQEQEKKQPPVIAEIPCCTTDPRLIEATESIAASLKLMTESTSTASSTSNANASMNLDISIENQQLVSVINQVLSQNKDKGDFQAQLDAIKATVKKNSGHLHTTQGKIDDHIACNEEFMTRLAALELAINGGQESDGLVEKVATLIIDFYGNGDNDPGTATRVQQLEDWVNARLSDESTGLVQDRFWTGKVDMREGARSATFPAAPLVVDKEKKTEVAESE